MKKTGAALARHALEQLGVTHTFGIPGVHNTELYDELNASEQIQPVLVAHECGAAFMADAASRTGNSVVISGGSGAQISVENAGEAAPGADVAFAIRPEKIRVSSKPPAEAHLNAMQGEVWDLAYLGDMTVYHIKLDDGQVVKASALNSARISDDPLTWSDRAWISFAPDAGVVLTR